MNKLNLKTKLYLKAKKAIITSIPSTNDYVVDIKNINKNLVYVFDSYEDYVNFYKSFIKTVNEDIINDAIYTTGRNGQIVALKWLCDRIILEEQVKEFYARYNDLELVKKIHARKKITPMEKVLEYESMDLCAPGDAIGSASYRCEYFGSCHKCLMEYASHKSEHDKFEFKLYYFEDFKRTLKK